MKRCDTFHDDLNDAGKQQFVSKLIYKLGGKAFIIYESKRYVDWVSLKKDLLEGIKVSKSLSALQNELMSMSQPFDKSAKEFADMIKEKLKELTDVTILQYDNTAVVTSFKDEHEKIAIRAFREGLRSPLKERVVNYDAHTSDALIKKAIEEEPFVKVNKLSTDLYEGLRIRPYQNGENTYGNNRNMSPPAPYRNWNKGRQFHERGPNMGRINRGNRFDSGMGNGNFGGGNFNVMICTRCNRKGHMKENCFARVNESRKEVNDVQNNAEQNFLEPPKNWRDPVPPLRKV